MTSLLYTLLIVVLQVGATMLNGAPFGSLTWFTSLFGAMYVSRLVFKKRDAFLWALFFNAGMLISGIQGGVFSEILQQPMFFLVNVTGLIEVLNTSKLGQLTNFFKKLGETKPYTVIGISVVIMFAWALLSYTLGSPVPVHDGILGGLAISAQVFSIAEHKYSWFGWMGLNVFSGWTWFLVGNLPLGFMYTIFFINALVGLYYWSRKDLSFRGDIES